jgi:hypothetical protein
MNIHEKKRFYLILPFILFVMFCFVFSRVNRPKKIRPDTVQNKQECIYASCSLNKVE